MFSTVLAWNTKTYGDKGPQNWADFWDVKKFPGKRSYRKGVAGALEPALMADGVPPDKVYEVLSPPGGIERAIKKIKELKPHIAVWWTSGAQHAQLMKDGEVDMITGWNGRFDVVAKDGGKVAYTYNQGLLDYDCFAIPKGAPNKAVAMKLLAEISKPQYQAEFTKYITYGPTNKKAYELGTIDAAYAKRLPSSPENAAQADPDQPRLVHQVRGAAARAVQNMLTRMTGPRDGGVREPRRLRLPSPFAALAQDLRQGRGARRRRPRRARRRVPDAARALGLGQDDAADDAGRLHPARRGQHPGSATSEVIRLAAAQARHRHGVPELRAVPAHGRGGEHRLPAAAAQRAARRERRSASRRRWRWCSSTGYGGAASTQLSGGQRQRVALARAIVFEPRIVLMDEPLSALDKQLRERMQIELRQLHEKLGMTTIYVTHDQREALTMSDRIAVIDNGRIMQLDTPRALYEHPANRFVAEFIGESSFLQVE